MQVFTTATELAGFIATLRKRNPNSVLGFVPTMGALHDGHMSLIKAAKAQSDFVLCSIFVNPTQFNDPADLERYPRTLERDTALLSASGCDFVYTPQVSDIYPEGLNQPYELDFGGLDKVMEGAFRPGHFKGVAQVVERFFQIIEPNLAFFGRKDFQQTAIINRMVQVRRLKVKVVIVETSRNAQGLALSSRNMLLSGDQLTDALIIFKTLQNAKDWAKSEKSVVILKQRLIDFFNQGALRLEYLEIVDDVNLQPIDSVRPGCTCCIAAYCGSVRLIDNMPVL